MRFSLRTFFLACLFVSSTIGVYLRREPWVRDTGISKKAADKSASESLTEGMLKEFADTSFKYHWRYTTDGAHLSFGRKNSIDHYALLIFDKRGEQCAAIDIEDTEPAVSLPEWMALVAYEFPDAVFINSETIFVGARTELWWGNMPKYSMQGCVMYRRRYPEYWWGHLYRVEVWTAIVSGVLLLATIARHVYNARRRTQTGIR